MKENNDLLKSTNKIITFLSKLTGNYLDENFLKENIEVLKLKYDFKSNFLTAAQAAFFASIPLAYNFYGKSSVLFWYFVVIAIISFFQMILLNYQVNKILFAIEYKLKNKSLLQKLILKIF